VLEFLKRRSVPATLNQAEKIHGHPDHLGEVLLALPQIVSYLKESKAELLPQAGQI
jgi:hypothetical protein